MKESMMLKRIIDKVLKDTFEDSKKYYPYKIEVVPKEIKSKHGHYIANQRKIEIFNLARGTGPTMLTCLHELTHHIEFMDLGETAHKESFYKRYHQLLLTALSHGIVTPDDLVQDAKDSSDLDKLIKYHGLIEFWDYELTEDAKKCFVLVLNGYAFRDTLKKRGYQFYSQNQAWGKEFKNRLYAVREESLIKESLPGEKVFVANHATVIFSFYYFVALTDAYDHRDFLKSNGYRWQAYGVKGAWVKKIPTSNYYQEAQILKDARLVFKRVTPQKISVE